MRFKHMGWLRLSLTEADVAEAEAEAEAEKTLSIGNYGIFMKL